MPSVAAVRAENDNLTKIIKYIPTEIITLYTAAVGIIPVVNTEDTSHPNLWIFQLAIVTLLVLTPAWKYYSVKDNPEPIGGSKVRAAWFHTIIATIAFALFVYVSNDPYLGIWFADKAGKPSPFLNPIAGTIFLLLFSFTIPMLEGWLLKQQPPIPPQNNIP